MDLLTAAEKRVEVVPTVRRWPEFAGLAIYTLVIAATIARHEPWADEAQSWLLARDAGLVDLWTRLLHYEGTTGLWQTLLHVLIRAGLPYAGMNLVAGLFASAASALILWRSPFPLGVRIALPFAYFLCYQYAVIARSYNLLPVLLFACAALFHKAGERPVLFTSLLCFMAAVSVHGMILSVSIGVAAIAQRRTWKQGLPYAGAFATVAAWLAFAASPAADETFVTRLNFSFQHFIDVGGKAFAAAFTGETFSSLAVVALSIPLLWRGGGLIFFIVASGLLCSAYAVVYSQVWHFGMLFLAWIFALWISLATRRSGPNGTPGESIRPTLATTALAIVIAVQCYWTSCAVRYDWNEAYSGSLAASQGLREIPLTGRRIYAIGFACVAIQPYFPRNIFSNWNNGHPEGYWDWSRRNHVDEDSQRLEELHPDYLMIGYKNELERGIWTDAVRKSGYQAIRHFDGNSFWQTHVFEPESFDLYRRDSGQ
jgi:hypothetical protein